MVGWGRGGGAVFFSPAGPGTQLLGGCHPELRVIPNREGWRSGVVAGGAVAGEEGAPRGCQRPGRQVAEPRAGAGSGVRGAQARGRGRLPPCAALLRLAPTVLEPSEAFVVLPGLLTQPLPKAQVHVPRHTCPC